MSRFDRFALFLSLLGILVSALVAWYVFERMPHIEDEIAYVWQARVMAAGNLTIPTPPHPKSFLVPFVIDYNGQRFGKYPLGWPAVLAVGERLGIRFLINPILAGLGVWLTYLLGKRVFNEKVALLAAGLTVTSPFFMINSGSLLSHPLGLVLGLLFALAWLAGFGDLTARRKWLPTLAAAFALGGLALTRPYTAVALGFPFAVHGLYLFVRGDRQTRLHLAVLALAAAALTSLHFVWQYLATGDPLLNLYTLWWPYDKIGFGPGHGHREQGHTLSQAWINTSWSLYIGMQDLFGWGAVSWLFLPFGIWAARKNYKALLLGSAFPSLVIIYLAYWIGSSLFGPRYYYEALFSLTLLSAAGIAFLAGWPLSPPIQPGEGAGPGLNGNPKGHGTEAPPLRPGWLRWLNQTGQALAQAICRKWHKLGVKPLHRRVFVFGVLALLVGYNAAVFLPARFRQMVGLYDMSRSDIVPFLSPQAQSMTPALVIVHPGRWMPYGVLLDLEDPFLTTPFIFTISRGPEADATLAADFPDRSIFHYYPVDEPYRFYTGPRPNK
jgi:hypothetical protein